ncbi:MAG: helix-turn-helix transcriptional regulator [Phycisphaerae bacterium]|nr:helix-turn-helix transcriptional regulator [Phycisphaerae bacterium]
MAEESWRRFMGEWIARFGHREVRSEEIVGVQEHNMLAARSLNEAIFRLGQVSADRSLTNASLLRRLADITVDALEVSVAVLAVFERGVESASSACHVRGPWSEDERDRFLEQTQWQFDERAMAMRLAGLRRGRLYHRPDLIAERDPRDTKVFEDLPQPKGMADQAVALYRRSDGVELLLAIHQVEGAGVFQRTTLAKAGALAPFVAQCWAGSWRQEPGWMKDLKPLSRGILEQLLEGFDDDQIADRTGLSYHSVRAHLKRLFRDAGVRSRLHLMQACRPAEHRNGTLIVEIPTDESARQATG